MSVQIVALIVILLLLMLFTFCSRLLMAGVFEPHMWYLGLHVDAAAASAHEPPLLVQYGFTLVSSLILFNTIIPISLAITVEGVKFIHSYYIAWDLELYDEAADRPAAAHVSTLSEELGLVRFVFTDKTGTPHAFHPPFRSPLATPSPSPRCTLPPPSHCLRLPRTCIEVSACALQGRSRKTR